MDSVFFHEKLALKLSRYLEEANIPDCMTKGKAPWSKKNTEKKPPSATIDR